MGKPSIFSRDYQNRMKRRRRRVFTIILLLIFCGGLLFASPNLKSSFSNKMSAFRNINLTFLIKNNNKNKVNTTKKQSDKTTPIPQNITPPAPKEVEQGVEVALSDETKIKAVYESKDGINKFKYITPIDAPVNFTVNPSGNSMVILENSTQSMFLVTIEGKVKKINDTKYISSSGGVITKEETLKMKTNYLWCSSPKFIDDNFIAYISQVPWFDNRAAKYVWVFNVNDNNITDRKQHTLFESLGGDNLKFGNITDKGLEVISDNKTTYIKYNGESLKISE